MFGDNQFRYALLSLAACEAPLQLQIGGYRCADPLLLPAPACHCIRNFLDHRFLSAPSWLFACIRVVMQAQHWLAACWCT